MRALLLTCAALIAAPVYAGVDLRCGLPNNTCEQERVETEFLAIVGGKLAIGDGSTPIPKGTVLIYKGRIVAADRKSVV